MVEFVQWNGNQLSKFVKLNLYFGIESRQVSLGWSDRQEDEWVATETQRGGYEKVHYIRCVVWLAQNKAPQIWKVSIDYIFYGHKIFSSSFVFFLFFGQVSELRHRHNSFCFSCDRSDRAARTVCEPQVSSSPFFPYGHTLTSMFQAPPPPIIVLSIFCNNIFLFFYIEQRYESFQHTPWLYVGRWPYPLIVCRKVNKSREWVLLWRKKRDLYLSMIK